MVHPRRGPRVGGGAGPDGRGERGRRPRRPESGPRVRGHGYRTPPRLVPVRDRETPQPAGAARHRRLVPECPEPRDPGDPGVDGGDELQDRPSPRVLRYPIRLVLVRTEIGGPSESGGPSTVHRGQDEATGTLRAARW